VSKRRRLTTFILTLLLIEFLDELVYGAREAAWPLVRDDLALTYTQIGLLLGAPGLLASFIEPFIGVLGDVWRRRALILGGGVFFALSLFLSAASQSFAVLLISFILFYPASGAFVSLSQAALMDAEPARHEQNMARWTFAGSLGVVAGPLALGAAVLAGLGWRGLYAVFGGLTVFALFAARRHRFPAGVQTSEGGARPAGLWQGFREAFRALRRAEVLRWLILLEFSDLLLDVLLGFMALYFVDVVAVSPQQAGVAVALWSVVGLAGDFLLIPLLERVRGLVWLRWSVLAEMALYPLFLLVPGYWAKVILLALIGFFNVGWYAILQGKLYSAMPGQSGSVMTVGSVSGLAGAALPVGLGWLGQRWGLETAMWTLLAAPIALLIGLPVNGRMMPDVDNETGSQHPPGG
jgi:FSR family fosmidomycin resistance protein-like MFS transporter